MASHPIAVATPVAQTPPLASSALAAMSVVERVTDLVDRVIDDLRTHLPGARPVRALRGGRWVVGMRFGGRVAVGDDGVGMPFTRLEFEVLAEEGALEMTARATVRDRDLDSCSKAFAAQGATGLDDDVRAFVEQQGLAFAEAWFAGAG